jgi:hypothetical protein
MALHGCITQAVELRSGIDALYLSAQGDAPAYLLMELAELRLAAEASDAPVDAVLGGYPVKVLPRAFGKYRYCAVHEMARIGITPSNTLPVVRFQPTAVALHAFGAAGTVLWARNFLDACGIEAVLGVSRLDLHSDWQGIEIKANERSNFVTYSERRALYEVGEEMSGLTFGKRGGSLLCRIYDKSREMQDKGHDWWPDVWGSAYDPEQKVMRVEFEFARAGLRDFAVDTPEDAFERAASLWSYGTCKWLSLRVPTADDTRSRWPVDPRWELIERSSLAGGCAPAERIKEGERQGTLRQYRKLATGVLSSMALPMGTDDIGDTLRAAEDELLIYERISGRTFPDRIRDKRQRATP